MSALNIGCIVLAAGRSRRFGRDKLTAPLAGKPVLAHVLDTLPRGQFTDLAVVTRQSCTEIQALCRARGVPCLINESGLLSESVRRGTERMNGLDGCLFALGDQPLLTARSVSRMLDAFRQEPNCVFRLAWQDTAGSPVLFPRQFFPRLVSLTGEQGGMAAVRGANVKIRLIEADSASELWDTDTPEALAAMERLLGENGPRIKPPTRSASDLHKERTQKISVKRRDSHE